MKELIKQPKILFIDLDGTALDVQNKRQWDVSQENLDAINECRKRGMKVLASTGRAPYKENLEIMNKFGDNKNFACWNGAKVFKDGKEIYSKSFSKDLAQEIYDFLVQNKMTIIINSDSQKMFSSCLIFKFVCLLRHTHAKKYLAFENNYEIFKFIVWNKSTKKLNKFKEILIQKYKDVATVVKAGTKGFNILEITPINCSKGYAEMLLAKSYGIDPLECVHIGDSMNDSTAIDYLGNVIAMRNSAEDFKKVATHVSQYDYKKAGLAKTLKELYL